MEVKLTDIKWNPNQAKTTPLKKQVEELPSLGEVGRSRFHLHQKLWTTSENVSSMGGKKTRTNTTDPHFRKGILCSSKHAGQKHSTPIPPNTVSQSCANYDLLKQKFSSNIPRDDVAKVLICMQTCWRNDRSNQPYDYGRTFRMVWRAAPHANVYMHIPSPLCSTPSTLCACISNLHFCSLRKLSTITVSPLSSQPHIIQWLLTPFYTYGTVRIHPPQHTHTHTHTHTACRTRT